MNFNLALVTLLFPLYFSSILCLFEYENFEFSTSHVLNFDFNCYKSGGSSNNSIKLWVSSCSYKNGNDLENVNIPHRSAMMT